MPDTPNQPHRSAPEEYTGGHTDYGSMPQPTHTSNAQAGQASAGSTSASGASATTARKSSPMRSLLTIIFVAAMPFFVANMLGLCSNQQEYAGTGSGSTSATTTQSGSGQGTTTATDSGVVAQGQGGTVSTEPTEGVTASIEGLRDHFVNTSAAQNATVMVYMCGSDLETYSSAATKDIKEMLSADLGNNVKIVLQTGGAKRWHFSNMADARMRQRWLIDNSGMYYLEDAGKGSILETQQVTDFANWAIANYPADRYLFVFWDHGGGTIGGYGNDEVYPNNAPLSLLELRTALANTNQKFDLVGFDACLMGTIETAYAMEPVADYLLASEEYEMGDGWHWTGLLNALGANPAIPTVELGKVAIDDFTNYYFKQRLTDVTLSLIDLREVPHVYEKMGDFLKAAEETITKDNSRFVELAQARTRARSFADGGLDQVDVADLIERTTFDGKDELLAAVRSCVKYRSGSTITGANGLAMYFPYSEVRAYQGTRDVLNGLGYLRPTEFYDYFLSIMSGSQGSSTQGLVAQNNIAYDTIGSAASAGSSSWSFADSSFFGADFYEQLLNSFVYQQVPDKLEITYNDGGYVIPMDNNMWNLFSSFKTTVMEKYGDGLLMLGNDDVYDQTSDGDIVLFYNNEWLTINGVPVSFFANEPSAEQNGEYSHSGTIPAILNGSTQIEISVYWPPESQQTGEYVGKIMGYRVPNSFNFLTVGRGLIPFATGDVITPLFDYYDNSGKYVRTEKGNPITVDNPDTLEARYELFDHDTVYFWGTMTTVYGDSIDTSVVEQ